VDTVTDRKDAVTNRKPQRHRLRITIRVAAVTLGVLLLASCAAVAAAVLLSVKVHGESMNPTLLNGQRLLLAPNTANQVRRFDVVVLRLAKRNNELIVKRVIAIPGDRVVIYADGNGSYCVYLQEGGKGPWYRVIVPAWAAQAGTPSNCCTSLGTRSAAPHIQTVPAGDFFYLGDNPDISEDSRTFGWGTISSVAGRVGWRIWPLSASTTLGNVPRLLRVPAPGAS
jgi:signal peptidase I